LIDSAASEYSPKFSPDGRWLAYQSDESGRLEIYVQRYPEGVRMPVSSDGGTGPVWSPDGRQLYFQGSDGSEPKLMALILTTEGLACFTSREKDPGPDSFLDPSCSQSVHKRPLEVPFWATLSLDG